MTRPHDRPWPNPRSRSTGSFHAGAPIPTLAPLPRSRRPSTHRYQTFPSLPPKTPVSPPDGSSGGFSGDSSDLRRFFPPARSRSRSLSSASASASSASSDHCNATTPLPVRQLLLLAFLSLSEQTALNSIGPYLPTMVASMPGIPPDRSGLYVGLLASAFALAQLSTNFLWGYASDLVGRKPVLLAGTASLMCCFCVFGFCTRYWHIVLVHAAMGLLNGNAACVPTVLGEVTDRSNQSRAFTYLPVIYSLGSITGPALGGILVGRLGDEFPFLAPNLLGAAFLATSVVVVGIWFEETLEEADDGPWKPSWIARLSAYFARVFSRPAPRRQESWSARWPRPQDTTATTTATDQRQPLLSPSSDSVSSSDDDPFKSAEDTPKQRNIWRDISNRTTMTLLVTYLIFQLANISFNSLYPIFAAAAPPTGRDLGPGKIGVSLSVAGLATIIFQAFLFQPLRDRVGSLGTYRFALLGLAISMAIMPWVGYLDDKPPFGLGSGKLWLYMELGVVLIIKNICAVGGLSSVMLLITNSAPSHASLGTLNGVAQTLSALGRSIGPFVSGGLFTLSMGVRPKGEALAWSLFGGLALVGWVGSVFIRGDGLESNGWQDDAEDEEEEDEDEEQGRVAS